MRTQTPRLRIVSLCPSATETAFALGLGPFMVGVSHQCDYPAEVSALPKLTSTWVVDEGDSRAIAEKVEANRERWGTIYDVDESLLAELKPDIIVTQQVCRVCALPADVALEVADRKLENCRVIPFTADRLHGFNIPRTLQEIHKATSRPGWPGLPAVKSGAVFIGNGKVITRYAPRIKEVVRGLAHVLHPEFFPQAPDRGLISPLFHVASGGFK